MGWQLNLRGNSDRASISTVAPLARSTDLVIEELDGEILVYDETSARAHCLSKTAARVWRACDGYTTVEVLGNKLDMDDDTVTHALGELESSDLLDAGPSANGSTRRELTFRAAKLGAIGASAPLIWSVMAPTPASAATPTPAQCLFYSGDSCDACTGICGCCCCCQGCSSPTVPSCKVCFPISMCDTTHAGDGCTSVIPGGGTCTSGPNCSATAKAGCTGPCPGGVPNCQGHPCNCFGIGNPC
jgi:hypothetical protein